MGMEKMAEVKIEKKEYGFRLVINNESYFIKDKGNGWFTMTVENEREAIDVIDEKYENLGTRDLNDLLCKLVIMPQALEMLLGEKINVEKISVEFD
jgi:hypothetical protein